MDFITAIFTYIMVWWIVLFVTLPWGNRQPQENEAGMAYGAPANPNLKKKLVATTLLSFLVLGMIYYVVEVDLFDFHEKAKNYENILYGGDSATDTK